MLQVTRISVLEFKVNSLVESRLWGSLCSGWLILVVFYGNGSFIISSIPKLKHGPYSIAEQGAHCDTPYSTDLSEAEQQIQIYNIRHSLLIVLWDLCKLGFSNWENPGEAALVTAEDAPAMHKFVWCLPPSSLPEPGFILPCSGFSGECKPLGSEADHWGWPGWAALTQLCVCTDCYWFGGTDADSRARSTPAWGLGREQFPLQKNGPLERHLCIQPQLKGWGTETRVWALFCFKSAQEGSFCDSGRINFTFLLFVWFLFSPPTPLLVHLAALNQNSGSCWLCSCCVRCFRQPQLWPRTVAKI